MTPTLHILLNQNYKLDADEAITLAGIGSHCIQIHRSISTIPDGSTVLPRYYTYPYTQLFYDLKLKKCTPVNTKIQRDWILNLSNWTDILGDATPKTYDLSERVAYPGHPVIIRSDYGTMKHLEWKHVYANSQERMMENYLTISRDSWHSQFKKYARTYENLCAIGKPLANGMTMADEWRLFYYKGRQVAHGTYWPGDEYPTLEKRGLDFADACARLLAPYIDFFTLDIARTATNRWIVIEVNDANNSGLQNIQPGLFYNKLYQATI